MKRYYNNIIWYYKKKQYILLYVSKLNENCDYFYLSLFKVLVQ